MQLTRFTDYALRTLTFLAIQPGDRLSTITEVADTFAISRNHVVKIVHQLGIKGYIETVRGKHGGIRLGRSAVSINLRDVVMDMEHVLCPVDCKRENCRLSGGCRIQGKPGSVACGIYRKLRTGKPSVYVLWPLPKRVRYRGWW